MTKRKTTEREPSLLSVTTSTAKTLIVKTGAVTELLLDSAEDAAHILNQTTKYARTSNAIWAARGLSDYTEEEQAFLRSVAPDVVLPAPQK